MPRIAARIAAAIPGVCCHIAVFIMRARVGDFSAPGAYEHGVLSSPTKGGSSVQGKYGSGELVVPVQHHGREESLVPVRGLICHFLYTR